MEILTGEQMRNVDRRAIDTLGIPGLLLMESAGRAVAEALRADYGQALERGIAIVCGKGNNGGDGLVAARHLLRSGVAATVVLLARGDELRGDAAVNLRAALASGVDVREAADLRAWETEAERLRGAAVVVDGVLGTGVRGGARGLAARAIAWMNGSGIDVVSIDIPSGLDADSHRVADQAVRAARTYTLCRPKLALVLEPAAEHAGLWRVLPIGIPDEAVRAECPPLEWLDDDVVAPLLAERAAASHKGTYGHLLAVAGSRGKSGAGVLLARGALRCGVGLMTVATPASVLPLVAAQQAELMTEPLAETTSGQLAARAARTAIDLLVARDALALGPGLGTGAGAREVVLRLLGARSAPTVLDADGLNVLGSLRTRSARARLAAKRGPLVLTPHPGEAARLLGTTAAEVQDDRLGAVRRLAEWSGAIVVLKGHRSLIAAPDGRVAVNATGNPGMASGGMGDVLTGMVGALLARGLAAWDAARLGVFLHGRAGDLARERRGVEGLIASDLCEALPGALRQLGRREVRHRW